MQGLTYYPVFLNLANKECLLVGGGKVAERKAIKLIEAGASLTIVAPELTEKLNRLKTAGRFTHRQRTFVKDDFDGVFLVIAATSDRQVNEEIAAQFNGLINVVDSPQRCSFIVPSSVTRGELTIAVSTSGASPALASTIRHELEALYPEGFADYVSFLRTYRQRVLNSNADVERKSTLIKEAAGKDFVEAVRAGRLEEVKARLSQWLVSS
ncbi:MAG: bifunctional precorrin-2 dehydrogenase/sirohydrochlorin ferrochelatase [Candidatus Magnetobacterium sp. LHC-1]|uniref:precorrin-2 dehydrogenase n=1 Tax=Candidatus Magnetobacterium casense TaxID=1455061 RepID=A0ABS6RWC4_9BACT|nr:bifunctional precorrin-2 dehydrogenase/sirohydrochlorin ferrochelatase [Candidatus Magnetobacterium casensis]MBF0606050.1 bifunctional precorrin-2 dehydrogenase/sirohydrochlorin ferrochelatase [Nitrospirota bacterium]MBV6340645.1 bifunctional precorrin-2 dehydrogenase/sirohydrochlorin ferrochelatase [Candidatus Magnetobacterium casensis]